MPEDKKDDLNPIPNEPPCFKYVDLAKREPVEEMLSLYAGNWVDTPNTWAGDLDLLKSLKNQSLFHKSDVTYNPAFGVVPDITEIGKQAHASVSQLPATIYFPKPELRDHIVTAVREMADRMLTASKYNPQDLVLAIGHQQPAIGQYTLRMPKYRDPVGVPIFNVEESGTIAQFFSNWMAMLSGCDTKVGEHILDDFIEVHSEVLKLVTTATPYLRRGNWYFRQQFGHGSRVEIHNAQYAGCKKKRHYRALVVRVVCPDILEDREEFAACELKLASLLKGLPVNVTLSARYGMLRIKMRWNRNVQNLFLKMLGDSVFPEINDMLQTVLPPQQTKVVETTDPEAIVGRGLSEHYIHLDPWDEMDFIPNIDNQETNDHE